MVPEAGEMWAQEAEVHELLVSYKVLCWPAVY